MEDVQDASPYDQLTLYNGTFMLLYDQNVSMAQVNVSETDVLGLMDTVFDAAKKLSVQKEQSKKVQEEIIDNYESYKRVIQRTYINVNTR